MKNYFVNKSVSVLSQSATNKLRLNSSHLFEQ
jgi:hypothetical protein